MSDTPETDAKAHSIFGNHSCATVLADFARKLERERDEAREMLQNWEDSAVHVEEDYPNEVHCGCVPVLRALLHNARRERDEFKVDRENLIHERDEAREKYDTLALENMLEVNKLCKERDETMDQLIHLRSCVYDVIHSLKAGAFDELEKAWKKGLK